MTNYIKLRKHIFNKIPAPHNHNTAVHESQELLTVHDNKYAYNKTKVA